MTTRRSLWAVLLAALGVKAYAKDKPCKPIYVPFQTPQSTWSGLPHWFYGGVPVNRQCPVCGTMHEVTQETDFKAVGFPGFTVRCSRCNAAFFQDAGV